MKLLFHMERKGGSAPFFVVGIKVIYNGIEKFYLCYE